MSEPSRWRRPETWLVALVVAPVEGGAYALAAVLGWTLIDSTAHFLTVGPFLVGVAAVLVATAPGRRRLFDAAESWLRDRQPDEGTLRGRGEGSLRGLLGQLRRGRGHGWCHDASVFVVWLLSWLALGGSLVGGLTLARYLGYHGAGIAPSHPTLPMVLLSTVALFTGVVAAAAGRAVPVATRPSDLIAARERVGTFGIHTALGFARGLVAGGVVLLLWPPLDALTALPVAAAVAVPTLCRVATFDLIGEANPSALPSRDGPRNVAVVLLAMLLVSAPMMATAAVRVDDTGFADAERRDLPEEPSAALSAATANTLDRSYRRTETVRVRRDGNWSTTRRIRAADRQDRQYWLLTSDEDVTLRSFFGEGVMAAADEGAGVSGDGPLGWRRGEWAADAGTPGAFLSEGANVETVHPGAPWEVVEQNDTAVVLGIDGAATASATPNVPIDDRYRVHENATARVVVDRERGVLESTRIDATYYRVEDGNRTDRRVVDMARRYENVGTHDVQRPDALGPRRPVEWLWDFLYY